uniref:Uncharacterized protein n=1 Tax=Arundo donax TaxID=35708 RepID=A0A0A8Y3F3_ARUDO
MCALLPASRRQATEAQGVAARRRRCSARGVVARRREASRSRNGTCAGEWSERRSPSRQSTARRSCQLPARRAAVPPP